MSDHKIHQQDDRIIVYTIIDDDTGELMIFPPGTEATWALAKAPGYPAVIMKTETSGISFPAQGKMEVFLSATDTNLDPRIYSYQTRIRRAGAQDTVRSGQLTILPNLSVLGSVPPPDLLSEQVFDLLTQILQEGIGIDLLPDDDENTILISSSGGGGSSGFAFTQASPLSPWIINHNLGYQPSVSLRSVGGLEVEAEVLHLSVNQVQVAFSSPQAGSAWLI